MFEVIFFFSLAEHVVVTNEFFIKMTFAEFREP